MKKQISLALAGVMALSLAACGGSASTATSTSEAASTAESTEASSAASTEAAAAGDVLDQAAAAAFAQDVTLTMWGAEEDQDRLLLCQGVDLDAGLGVLCHLYHLLRRHPAGHVHQ